MTAQLDAPDDSLKSARRFRDHYAASQFRSETWNELRHEVAKLVRAQEFARDGIKEGAAVAETLELLSRIERYWAFPGRRICSELKGMQQRGHARALARRVDAVVRLLISDAYRRRDVGHLLDGDGADRVEGEEAVPEPVRREERPYFEVLVVDDLDPAEERDLRSRLLDVRGEDDEFVYEVVVVPTFEDAVIAVHFNHNVQSCVLRNRFPVESRTLIPELRHYLAIITEEQRAMAETEPCTALAEVIANVRPELDLFKGTDETFGSVAATGSRLFRRVFYRQETTSRCTSRS